MKTSRVVIFIAAMLSLSSVNAQETEIRRLKTQRITLMRQVPWTLVEKELRYYIVYGALSLSGNDRWLQLAASPNGGTGLLKDLGEMSWAEVDRMPRLELKPFLSGFSISHIGGEPFVGPQGFVVKARAGHVYAVHIKDSRTDHRVIFRIESIDLKGECKLSWKRVPSKWPLGPGDDLPAQSKANEKLAKLPSSYAGPPANEILAKSASVYAGCRTYSDEGFISFGELGSSGTHFRTTFSRPDTLGFELWWQGAREPLVAWKQGAEVTNSWPHFIGARTFPLDTALEHMSFNSQGGSLLVPPLLLPSLFRITDAFALLVDARVVGEGKVDGLEAFRITGTLLGQQIELWIDKTDYLIRRVVRAITLGNQQVESTTEYKPKINSDIPPERLTFRPPTGKAGSSAINSVQLETPSRNPPSVAPRLRSRGFGSSLSRRPNEKAPDSQSSAGDIDVVRVDTDLVLSAVLVLDPQGKVVTGLTQEDFIIKEDNTLQQVESLSLGDNEQVPRSIVLIIDYSPSQLPYIKTSIESAKMLVDKLNPKDRMAVVTDDVQLLTDFTSDKQLLKEKLDGLKTSALAGVMGASIQYDALMATLNELFDNEDLQPIVILQSDGDQLDLLKGAKIASADYWLPRKYGFPDVLSATERARATIYPVISGVKFLGVPEAELLDRSRRDLEKRRTATRELREAVNARGRANTTEPGNDALRRNAERWFRCQSALAELAKSAGAWAEFLEEPDQADEIYTRVLKNIQHRYVLGYYPTNRTRDGKRRKVSVEVRNHPEYIIVGHKSYLAREE